MTSLGMWCLAGRLSVNHGELRRYLAFDMQTQFEREIPMLILHCSLVVFFSVVFLCSNKSSISTEELDLFSVSLSGEHAEQDFCFESLYN